MPCLGITQCTTTTAASDFYNFYDEYPVQNLCQVEPVACYQAKVNGGDMCPDWYDINGNPHPGAPAPDCGGSDGAAMILYGCEMSGPTNTMFGEMDCAILHANTGICFNGAGAGNQGDSNAGSCIWEPGPPPPPPPPPIPKIKEK